MMFPMKWFCYFLLSSILINISNSEYFFMSKKSISSYNNKMNIKTLKWSW